MNGVKKGGKIKKEKKLPFRKDENKGNREEKGIK